MKLKNKKTGEIIDIHKGEITLHYDQGRKTIHFKRLEDLEEWEDYEEPKRDYYYIDYNGTIKCFQYLDFDWQEEMKQIGNYFETKEEAEKTLERLKKLQILRNKGYRIDDYIDDIIKAGEE